MMCAARLITLNLLPYNATNTMYSFVATVNENNFAPLSPIMVSRYKRYITYGIRARVKTLGPIGFKMFSAYFVLTND